MFSTVEFLDAVKHKHGLESDYALAKFLGWRQTRISQYRGGHRELDDNGCVQIAEKLDLPPAHVMACIASRRAENASLRGYWKDAAKLLKDGTWALAVVTVGALAQIAPAPASANAAVNSTPYTLCVRRRRRAGELQRRRRRRKSQTVIVAAANGPESGNTLAG